MPTILLTLLLSTLSLGDATLPDSVARAIDQTMTAERSLQPPLAAYRVPYLREILSAAQASGLPPSLLAGVIQEESRFSPWATRSEARYERSRTIRKLATTWSHKHHGIPNAHTELVDRSRSYGLMQVMGETAREQGFDGRYLAELYLPKNAIEHGARLLKRLLVRYHHDTLSAISAYNQGTARKRNGLFVNARYVYRVTLAWRIYEAILREGGLRP